MVEFSGLEMSFVSAAEIGRWSGVNHFSAKNYSVHFRTEVQKR